ncbi:hypothetical protein CS022_05805 [Veronia nyctiphanis]|uniref:Metalloprotease StcE beta-sandwich domain-containing protein n=1 Tax=Veronia nyctiphanis TaxID=1278244 RepID=A0A4Q0YYI3_9GAMM|nr:thrombospondin type 3 repeat-containing protein [Veronia nyctiphanis]RXJ74131.1 hypothetical protein CS022_05805 [Veronia nyctiphanis]
MHNRFSRLIIAFLVVSLSACDKSAEDVKTASGKSINQVKPEVLYRVTVIDGYLDGATVWVDLDADYELDQDEPSAVSGANGDADINVAGIDNAERYPIVALAVRGKTIDEDTQLTVPYTFLLSMPPGYKVITPLTTLLDYRLRQQASAQPQDLSDTSTHATAVSWIATHLGLPKDVITTDFIKGEQISARYAAMNLVAAGVLPENAAQIPPGIFIQSLTPTLLNNISLAGDAIKQMLVWNTSKGNTDIKSMKRVYRPFDPDVGCDKGYVSEGKACVLDSDDDNIGNARDTDDDNDGVEDNADMFPLDPQEYADFDGDGIGNRSDLDDDGDGVLDANDAFPLNTNEWIDTDGDGIGNNTDNDDDGDGVVDEDDQFPLDKTQTGRQTVKHNSYIAFNQNSFNDLSGDLSAYVLFAQHSIIPAGNHIQGDLQPHLTGNRKTLVMVKPEKNMMSGDALTMQVIDAGGNDRYSVSMETPRWIPGIAGQLEVSVGFDWDPTDFDLPSSYDATVSGESALAQLDKSGAKLLDIFKSAQTVKVATRNGSWRSAFYLPTSEALDGKKIVFQSSAGYGSTVYYGNSSTRLTNGTTLVLVNYKGAWLQASDIELTKVKYGRTFGRPLSLLSLSNLECHSGLIIQDLIWN